MKKVTKKKSQKTVTLIRIGAAILFFPLIIVGFFLRYYDKLFKKKRSKMIYLKDEVDIFTMLDQ